MQADQRRKQRHDLRAEFLQNRRHGYSQPLYEVDWTPQFMCLADAGRVHFRLRHDPGEWNGEGKQSRTKATDYGAKSGE